MDIPEFATELDDIDDGFNAICVKLSDQDVKNLKEVKPGKDQSIKQVSLKSLDE